MSTITFLHDARAAEKEQALFYRALAALAEERRDAALSERLNGLHADEQHHLSRLTARLVELNEPLADLSLLEPPSTDLDTWEDSAHAREADEIARYEMLLAQELDADTRTMIEAFLEAERAHARELGGKWMDA
ncbi:MAG TPA: ferritin family protein [Longimicrobiales bacterium]|nr:ferritin family protein [Longimicrobiales bacterium]